MNPIREADLAFRFVRVHGLVSFSVYGVSLIWRFAARVDPRQAPKMRTFARVSFTGQWVVAVISEYPAQSCHSDRSASIGSIRDARLAGSNEATMAIRIIASGTVT